MNIIIPANSSLTGSSSAPFPTPASPPLSQKDYPHIAYWNRRDYEETDLTSISDDNQSKLQFLEHEDGSLFLKEEIDETRKHAREAFQTLLNEKLSPPTWSQASSTASNFFRKEMLTYCPELRFCANNWKVDALATEIYSQWVRRRREQVQELSRIEQIPTNNNKKRKSQDDEQADAQKSKSKASKRAKPNSVNVDTSHRPSSATTSLPIASTSHTTMTSRALATATTTSSRAIAGASSNPVSSTALSLNATETESDDEDLDDDDEIDDLATPEEPATRSKGKAKEQPKGNERERPEVPPIKVVNPLYVLLELPRGLAVNLTISSSRAFPNKSTAKASRLDTVPDVGKCQMIYIFTITLMLSRSVN